MAETKLELPPVDQLGFVVSDMDQAIAHYTPLFGEFQVQRYELEAVDYRGQSEDCELKVAFAMLHDMEIELIELLSGKSPHQEFLEQGRRGLHHIRFRVPRVEQALSEVAPLGYRSIWFKRMSDDLAFAYAEHESGTPPILEFLEMPAA